MQPIVELPLGTTHHFNLDVPSSDGSPPGQVPMTAIVGQRHTPCVAFVAAVHGDEYDGILALHELAREIDSERLHGSLIIVPVANPFAFAGARRRSPEDDQDLNRVFPGRPDGTLTERLAYALCHEVFSQATLVCTLHGAMATSVFAPWIEFLDVPGPVGQASYEAARASGFPDLIALPNVPGILITAMAELGVPVVEGEVGGRGTTRPRNVTYYKDRVYAIARHTGILPAREDGVVAPTVAPRIWHLFHQTADVDGMLLNEVSLSQHVKAGERLGTVLDLRGQTIKEVRAPRDSVVAGYHDHAGIRVGEIIYSLFSPAQTSVYKSDIATGRQEPAEWSTVVGPGA